MYLKVTAELHLFVRWLAIPHPELHLECYVSELRAHGGILATTPRLEAYVATMVTEEQKRKFARPVCAQCAKSAHRLIKEMTDNF